MLPVQPCPRRPRVPVAPYLADRLARWVRVPSVVLELDFQRVRGRPLRLATAGWVASLVLGLAAGLVLRGLSFAGLVIGLALTTTALGAPSCRLPRTRGCCGHHSAPGC
jgi:hypothetical protein